MSRSKDSKRHHSILDQLWFALVLLVLIIGVVVAAWWMIPQSLGTGLNQADNVGVFGDSFGSVNALFTGLAFTGVVFSILLQQRQIRLQREDFLNQLSEMEKTSVEMEEQTETYKQQFLGWC